MTDTSNKFWHKLVKLVPFTEQKLANNIYDKNVSLQPNSLFTKPQVIGASLCLFRNDLINHTIRVVTKAPTLIPALIFPEP